MAVSVYMVTRRDTGDQYVGVTNRPAARWREHTSMASRGSRTRFHNALRKYGREAFTFRTVARLPTMQEALIAERILITLSHPRYNLTAGGEGAPGMKHTDVAKAKMSAARVGKTNCLGFKHTAETRRKMSEAARGKPKSAEHRAKIGAAHTGMKRSPGARVRMSAAQKQSAAKRLARAASTKERASSLV